MSANKTISELQEMFTLGRDMPAPRWMERMGADRAFSKPAKSLVWQADGRRFMAAEGYVPEGPVSLAHPVELDAPEILRWRGLLSEAGITQPFRQMWEPVVLVKGKLPGEAASVQSAGERYRMLSRYRDFNLPFSAMTALKEEGFRFIERRRWDRDKRQRAEVQVVNIVTPAGILYNCEPDERVKSLSAERNANLVLNLFYPFEDTRLRTLNHVAAVLEEHLLSDMIELDLLLPHLPGMTVGQLLKLRVLCGQGDETAALLDRLLARKGALPC